MNAHRLRSWLAIAVAFLSASAPFAARACAVCFSAKSEANRIAFLATTVLLTGLPVAMIGGFIYWIMRRIEKLDVQEQDEQSVPAEAARGDECQLTRT